MQFLLLSNRSLQLILSKWYGQFRNLPTYYSGDVVLRDTEDNIVSALNEDLLDDRVTTLVITQSTSLGKPISSSNSASKQIVLLP